MIKTSSAHGVACSGTSVDRRGVHKEQWRLDQTGVHSGVDSERRR